jgi:hypothetical protein
MDQQKTLPRSNAQTHSVDIPPHGIDRRPGLRPFLFALVFFAAIMTLEDGIGGLRSLSAATIMHV